MFDDIFIKKLKNFVIFILVYTLLFVLFFSTLPYTFPFVIGILVSIVSMPLVRLFKKWKFKDSIAALISVLLVYVIFITSIILIFFKIINEIKLLISSIPNINTIMPYIQEYLDKLKVYYDQIDPSIIDKVQQQVVKVADTGLDITIMLFNKLVSFAIQLPVMFLILFVSLLSSFFFTRDMLHFKSSILNVFSKSGKQTFSSFINELLKSVSGYLRAYSFIVFLTFLETLIGFSILGIKYSLLLSILAAFFDVLPILGIGVVYSSVSLFFILTKNYAIVVGIIILYILVTVVRQILEPKLLSTSLGLHPVAVLASIFIGIKAYGFLGMIYFLFMMVFYNILKKINTL